MNWKDDYTFPSSYITSKRNINFSLNAISIAKSHWSRNVIQHQTNIASNFHLITLFRVVEVNVTNIWSVWGVNIDNIWMFSTKKANVTT